MTEPVERKDCSEEWAHREIYFGINVNKKLHNNLTPSHPFACIDKSQMLGYDEGISLDLEHVQEGRG